jgi:FKBP-type peptidyl-prolyl cis-trans isomerase
MRPLLLAALLSVAASPLAAQTVTLKVIPPPPDVAAPPADAKTTASGLATKVLQPGTGTVHPTADDTVTVNYTGWTTDGKMFDSSVARGRPSTFALNRVIPGFTEALEMMVPGEKRRVWIPEQLAYKGQREPKGTLVFDLELIDVPSHPPADVKAPPRDAQRTATGLAYKVLKPGNSTRHPSASSSVTVHYTGWTTDGKMFDSSVVRGQPITFRLDQVIQGWTEGVQLMVEGEKARFWIPENLAYKGRGPVNGMLVFDIELLKIN